MNQVRSIFSSAISKIIIIIILIVAGAVVDVQLLKAKVGNIEDDVKKINSGATIDRQIICEIANKVQAFDDEKENLCLKLIR